MIVPFKSLIKSLQIISVDMTPRRIWNLLRIYTSLFISKVLKKPVVWGYPPLMMIEPTNICNLKCPMCPSGNGEMKREQGKLNPDHYKKLMDEIGGYLLQVQLWNQGEPFINKSFLELVRYAKEKGIMTQTSTNGHFIRSDAAAEELIRSGLDLLIFSLDGTNQETYEQYRVGGNYLLVMETLERISRMKTKLNSQTPLIELQFLVFKHNKNEIDTIIEISKNLNINRLSFKSAQVYSSEQADRFLPEETAFNRYQVKEDKYMLRGEIKNWCKRLWLNPAVNWDGSVSPCCFDKDGEHAFANIFQNGISFKTVWKGSAFQDFRRRVLRDRRAIGICTNCTEGLPDKFTRIVEVSDM